MNSMTTISTAAASRREAARHTNGEFGEHTHSTPELSLGESAWPQDLGITHHDGQWGQVSVGYGARTPWGPAQHEERVADGIVFVPTETHGGYKLSPERNASIPPAFRNGSGWYDEDDDRVYVELYHYDAVFNRRQDVDRDRSADLERFDQKIRDRNPDGYEKAHKVTLEPGQSRAKDERVWGEDNADEYVATAQETIEDGLILVTARRASTGDVDQFILNRVTRDEAKAEAADEPGAGGRFRVPAGTKPQPRPEPEPAKPAFTTVPSTEGRTAAAAKAIQADLDQRWRLRDDGSVKTLRQQIEDGHITAKSVQVSEAGTRAFYLENENTGSSIKVSKATFEAFAAPDLRSPKDLAFEQYRIAAAKQDKVQRKYDASFRPSSALIQDLRAANAVASDALARWQAATES